MSQWSTRVNSSEVKQPFASSEMVWDEQLVRVMESEVLSAARDQAGKARSIAAVAPQSGAFLHAHPCSSLGTRLDNSSLRISIALRLGAPVCLPHTCVCGVYVYRTGIHGLSCRKSTGRLSRYSAVIDLIKRSPLLAEISSKLEKRPCCYHKMNGDLMGCR